MPAENRLRTDQYVSIAALCVVLIFYRGLDNSISANKISKPLEKVHTVYSIPIEPIPITNSELDSEENQVDLSTITASAAAVIDLNSNTILFQKNSTKRYLPASTTKLMTALVVRELYDLDEVVTISNIPDVDGAEVTFFQGEQLTVESLLKALLIQSGNDAAIILAEHHPEGIDAFIAAMNDKAAELNLNDTHFQNVIGFDHPDQHSTAFDLALLSKAVMEDEVIRTIVRQPRTLITDLTGSKQHFLYSTNLLLSSDPTVVGIKTGTTEGAGEVLITQVERDGKKILLVVLGSEDRYLDTLNLIEWTFKGHSWTSFEEFE